MGLFPHHRVFVAFLEGDVRDDPLGRLYARRHIDEAQYRVGLILLELFELGEIGSVQAIDPCGAQNGLYELHTCRNR
jgi:hypothetical protein